MASYLQFLQHAEEVQFEESSMPRCDNFAAEYAYSHFCNFASEFIVCIA